MAATSGKKHVKVKVNWGEIQEPAAAKKTAGKNEDKKGTRAIIVLDSFAKKTEIPGRVVESSPLPKDTGPHWMETGTKAYEIYVGVDWEENGLVPGKNIRPGMGGKVTLVLDTIPDTLTIPVLSVYNKEDRYFCKKIVNGTPVDTEIEIGRMNESRVQVLSGLEEGDRVLLVARAEGKPKREKAESPDEEDGKPDSDEEDPEEAE